MNKKILVGLMLVPMISLAQDAPFDPSLRGIQIVPLEKINMPPEIKQKMKMNLSINKNNDYENTDDNDAAKFLINIKEHANNQFANASKYAKYGDGDTSMKHSLQEIKLAIPFKPIKGVNEKDIIGYAAGNSFVEGKGWTGISVFFSNEKLGNCSYQYTKILSVMLAKEDVAYLVNKKPGGKSIKGNQYTGFKYNITWYDNDAAHELDCANKEYNPKLLSMMIVLANVIDKG